MIFFKTVLKSIPKKFWIKAGTLVLSCLGAICTLLFTHLMEEAAKKTKEDLTND